MKNYFKNNYFLVFTLIIFFFIILNIGLYIHENPIDCSCKCQQYPQDIHLNDDDLSLSNTYDPSWIDEEGDGGGITAATVVIDGKPYVLSKEEYLFLMGGGSTDEFLEKRKEAEKENLP